MNVADVKRCIKSALFTKILKLIHVETGKIGPVVDGSGADGSGIVSGSGADGTAAGGYGVDASEMI